MNTYSFNLPNGAKIEFFASDSTLFNEVFFGLEFPKDIKQKLYERRLKQKRKAQKIARRKSRK
ncbi:hypothetical protein MY791_05460 [Haemophilus influenzae]|nr:hypothetical protein [Haemophilus influenzae]